MAAFPRDTIRNELQRQATQAFPEIIKMFWDLVVEGYDVKIGIPNHILNGLEYCITIGPGRVYLSPRAGAPC